MFERERQTERTEKPIQRKQYRENNKGNNRSNRLGQHPAIVQPIGIQREQSGGKRRIWNQGKRERDFVIKMFRLGAIRHGTNG